jgi:hypothetical protein
LVMNITLSSSKYMSLPSFIQQQKNMCHLFGKGEEGRGEIYSSRMTCILKEVLNQTG